MAVLGMTISEPGGQRSFDLWMESYTIRYVEARSLLLESLEIAKEVWYRWTRSLVGICKFWYGRKVLLAFKIIPAFDQRSKSNPVRTYSTDYETIH
jgi:hypothetical protein